MTTLTTGLVCGLLLATQPELETVAERSRYQATSTYEEVTELLTRINRDSNVMRMLEFGHTADGRPIPLVLLANPPVESAAEVRDSGKLLVFAFGNIHGGEVCGKEALLMLTREIAVHPRHPLLDRLALAFVPILNADGNDRMSTDNRPGQVGPARGMGERVNSQGLDLNRDYVKLESPEILALVDFLNEWDPAITIDTHTTNGSRHRYELTYAPPLNPSGHDGPIGFVRDELLPSVSERLRDRIGYETFLYGNFDEDRTVWRTYSSLPRFGGPYRGLRGNMSVLSEAYAYASYQDRVLVTREFIREILGYAAEHADRIRTINERARVETIAAGMNPQPDDIVGIRHGAAAMTEPATIRTFRPDDPEIPQEVRVVHLGRFEPLAGVRRPHGYLLGPGLDAVVTKLRQHGITDEPWTGDAMVETYAVTEIRRAEREFQGHTLVQVDTEASLAERSFAEGTRFVTTAQPLGNLVVYLLEPESQDGLVTWNFLDEWLEVDGEYPVYRVRTPGDLNPG